MRTPSLAMAALAATLALATLTAPTVVLAQDQQRSHDQDRIYGSQLMTQQERLEYRNRLQAAKTAAERKQIQAQHREEIRARAQARGITLPDEPSARGKQMDRGKRRGGKRGG